MSLFILILIGFSAAVAVVVIGARVYRVRRARLDAKPKTRRHVNKPSVSFYLKKPGASTPNKKEICLKNTGRGKAIDISIGDFYHPDEKNWRFKFQEISLLDPGEEKAVDFNFFAGAWEASNKTDQLWMFDPDHDHDFAARIVVSYCDVEKNAYEEVITIGEKKKKPHAKIRQLQMIQEAMSREKKK